MGKSSVIREILSRCPILTSKSVINASLGVDISSSSTPWLNSGDIRTLVPFLTFSPMNVSYTRRWVRVPLADGPRGNLADEDKFGSHESVALDWANLSTNITGNPDNDRGDSGEIALLILAGLTGGSTEGYILDMVTEASKKGWMCFVMTGRVLAGIPCA